MKKILFILTLLFLNVAFLRAQDGEDQKRGEKVEALKVAFITQKLNLSSDEAQRFWPVYNRYEVEMKQALRQNNSDVIDNDEHILNIRKRYRNEFSGVLGGDRVNTLFRSENEFRGALMRQLRNRAAQRPVNKPYNRQGWRRR